MAYEDILQQLTTAQLGNIEIINRDRVIKVRWSRTSVPVATNGNEDKRCSINPWDFVLCSH